VRGCRDRIHLFDQILKRLAQIRRQGGVRVELHVQRRPVPVPHPPHVVFQQRGGGTERDPLVLAAERTAGPHQRAKHGVAQVRLHQSGQQRGHPRPGAVARQVELR
jgi:hypothetical protein